MQTIRINCNFEDLDEILYGDEVEPEYDEIPEDEFRTIMEVANV